jgi:hypothetical protein
MAISNSPNVLAILKIIYKDGVRNLLFRNSPVLRKIPSERVEGKEIRYSAMFGRGGATSGDYTVARTAAAETARNAEWKITPGQQFSPLMLNQKEILSSKTKKGAYMKVLQNKVMAALEGSRKQLGKALYGTGYGEICLAGAAATLTVGSNTLTIPEEGAIGVDIGTMFRFIKPGASGTLGSDATVGTSLNTVTAIDGNVITFTATAANTYAATDWLCYEGSRDATGNPLLPVGLGSWLPTVGNRAGTAWNTYIANPFYGITRNIATDRLSGQFVLSPASGYKIADVISELYRKCRRAGAEVDLIIMNDRKYAELIAEIQAATTYWQSVNDSDKGKRTAATKGFNEIAFAFSTSFLDRVVDDPYCPYEKIYALESKNLGILTYTNEGKIVNDGIGENSEGKQDPESSDDTAYDEMGTRLNIEDIVSIEQGTANSDGPTQCISFNLYGTFVLFNTSNSGVAVLQ